MGEGITRYFIFLLQQRSAAKKAGLLQKNGRSTKRRRVCWYDESRLSVYSCLHRSRSYKIKFKKKQKHHRLATQKAVTGGSVEANASMTSHHLTHLPGVELPVVESTCIIVIIRLIPPSSQVFIRSGQTGRSCHPRLTEPGMNVTVSP